MGLTMMKSTFFSNIPLFAALLQGALKQPPFDSLFAVCYSFYHFL